MSLQLVLGPMFSGKTTELIRLLKRHQYANRKVLLIKHSIDSRYGNPMQCNTHDGLSMPAISGDDKSLMVSCSDIASQADVIGVDEGQFYNNLHHVVEVWLDLGKTVIISALDGDYNREIFPQVAKLIPLANSFSKLTAVCSNPGCSKDGIYTAKKTHATSRLIEVGGAELYHTLCRECYMKDPSKYNK